MSTSPAPSPLSSASLLGLRQISRALFQADDLDTTLDLIARTTAEVMSADSCAIYLLDPDGETLRLRATTGLAQRALGRAVLKVGEGLTGMAVQLNTPIYAANAQSDPRFKWLVDTDERDFQSLLAVPLDSNNRAIGALNIQTRTPHTFTHTEVETLSLIGDLAAGALARAQLLDQQARQLAELQTLATISQTVTAPQYLNDMLAVVCEMTTRVMDASVCAIYLVDDDRTHLILQALHRADHDDYQPQPRIEIGAGLTGQVAATGRASRIADLSRETAYLSRDRAEQVGLRSLLSVPLTVRDHVIGVLNCYTREQRHFTDEQERLLDTLSNQTALAIENARLVTNAAMMREMHHRIKNNLQTVTMLMRLQLSDRRDLTARDVLQESITRINSIAAVHEVLSERGYRLVDVTEVLQRVLRATQSMRRDLQLHSQVMGEIVMLPSRAATALTLVVNELVQNAIEHGFSGRTEGHITITLSHTPDLIVVTVRDDGHGLANSYQPGLGLEIATTLVHDDLNGHLTLTNSAPGTLATLEIPRHLEQLTP